jgi:hypothetical protein
MIDQKNLKKEEDNQKDVILDTSYAKNFYNDNNISDYDGFNVVYLLAIGICYGRYLLKYGLSSRIYEREFKEHKLTFGNQIKMLSIVKTDNNKIIEELFEKEIISKNLAIKIKFNGKWKEELFLTSKHFTIKKAIELMQNLAFKNPSKNSIVLIDRIKELETEIKLLKMEKQIIADVGNIKKEENKIENKIVDKVEIKADDKVVKKIENNVDGNVNKNDIYLQFLNIYTQETKNEKDKIHCVNLYLLFKEWFKCRNPDLKIPCDKDFVRNLRKHKNVCEDVRIGDKVRRGIKCNKIKEI